MVNFFLLFKVGKVVGYSMVWGYWVVNWVVIVFVIILFVGYLIMFFLVMESKDILFLVGNF